MLSRFLAIWCIIKVRLESMIGYDCDGKEFYSDDTLIDSANIEIPVEELIIKYKEIGEHFYNFKLKG